MNAIATDDTLASYLDTTDAIPLSALRPGQRGTIVTVDAGLAAGRRLLALGFVPGSAVGVRRIAPLRDPVEYTVRGACVSLRRQEAAWVMVLPDAR